MSSLSVPPEFAPYVDFVNKFLESALALWDDNSAESLHRSLADLSDEEWAEVLCRSTENSVFGAHLLPRFIDNEMQTRFVGSSGISALREAQVFVKVVLHYARQCGIALDDHTKAVDFGCGWGRYTRFMIKYIHPNNLYGLDVNGRMIEHCRKSFGMATFLKTETMPPCDLRGDLVDLVFGYSVFSHLSPDCADAWIDEFARIVRPGGILVMTTQGRSFIEYCRDIRVTGDLSHHWHYSLAQAFTDVEQSYRDYDSGLFLHHATGQADGTYGESLVPRGYIERQWLEHFELVDFVDDRGFLPQALFVLRRR